MNRVSHLAGKLIRAIKGRQPDLEIDKKDILCVEIAGLCHDLGKTKSQTSKMTFNTGFVILKLYIPYHKAKLLQKMSPIYASTFEHT